MGEDGRYKHTLATPGRKIVMTRVFDAPRELVFDAHSSCEHVSHWWGPRNHEVVQCEIDFRPGGAWRIAHRGPDARDPGVLRRVPRDRPPRAVRVDVRVRGHAG